MIQLENRAYPKVEMAELLGLDPKNKNFKRAVETTLTSWGYKYEFPPYSKTITITYIPEGEDKLAELLIRDYGIDVRTNPVEFACFLHAFNHIDGFISMPWGERAKAMADCYGVEVCDRTLRNWANKLFTSGTLMKCAEKTYWKSAKISDTETLREPVEKSEFSEFYKYRREAQSKAMADMILAGRTDYEEIRKESWTQAHFAAMNEFKGWCYFSCKTILLSAFDDKDLAEIFELVEEIAPILIEGKRRDDEIMNQLRKQKELEVQAEIARLTQNGEFIF